MSAEEFTNMVFDKIDINGDGELWIVRPQQNRIVDFQLPFFLFYQVNSPTRSS